MTIVVTGNLAIDNIAAVADGFQDGDLNGKLDAPEPHWGGCGMNLAYGVARAGANCLPWVFYGDDCPQEYLDHINANNIDQRAMHCEPGARCATAFVFTRHDGSQLTGFYPGTAAFRAPTPQTQTALQQASHWIAGPEDDATLLARLPHIAANADLYWMPGQYAEVTRNNVLQPMLARQPNLIVNSKEWQTLLDRVGPDALHATTKAVFITRGSEGVRYRTGTDGAWQEQAADLATSVDPTGCGDAFCATLVAGLSTQRDTKQDIRAIIRNAQSQAVRCLATAGAQRY